jgi:hypothetical protein
VTDKAPHTCGFPNGTQASRETCPRCRELAEQCSALYHMRVPRALAEAIVYALVADGVLCVRPMQPTLPGMEVSR